MEKTVDDMLVDREIDEITTIGSLLAFLQPLSIKARTRVLGFVTDKCKSWEIESLQEDVQYFRSELQKTVQRQEPAARFAQVPLWQGQKLPSQKRTKANSASSRERPSAVAIRFLESQGSHSAKFAEIHDAVVNAGTVFYKTEKQSTRKVRVALGHSQRIKQNKKSDVYSLVMPKAEATNSEVA